MGRILKFDPRQRTPRRGRPPPPWRDRRGRRLLGTLRPLLLFGALILLWVTTNPELVKPWGPLALAPERIDERFTRCGPGRGHACVIDGDTFKLGQRSIRIAGIDAPETHPPHCAEEAAKGETATARLQALLNEGAFEMIGARIRSVDAYGRDLRTLVRDGHSITDGLIEEGLVRRYAGFKMPWC